MRLSTRLIVLLSCLVVAVAFFPVALVQGQAPAAPQGQGQPPPGPPGGPGGPGRGAAPALQNIKVLPKTWTRQQVQALMQTFVVSLGQQPPAQGAPAPPKGQGEGCLHCHVISPTPPPAGGRATTAYDLDTNPNKDIARTMVTMTMAINESLKDLGDKAVVEKVSCFTCHKGDGTAKPTMMPAAGWGRGGFSLLPAGPPMPPARGGN